MMVFTALALAALAMSAVCALGWYVLGLRSEIRALREELHARAVAAPIWSSPVPDWLHEARVPPARDAAATTRSLERALAEASAQRAGAAALRAPGAGGRAPAAPLGLASDGAAKTGAPAAKRDLTPPPLLPSTPRRAAPTAKRATPASAEAQPAAWALALTAALGVAQLAALVALWLGLAPALPLAALCAAAAAGLFFDATAPTRAWIAALALAAGLALAAPLGAPTALAAAAAASGVLGLTRALTGSRAAAALRGAGVAALAAGAATSAMGLAALHAPAAFAPVTIALIAASLAAGAAKRRAPLVLTIGWASACAGLWVASAPDSAPLALTPAAAAFTAAFVGAAVARAPLRRGHSLLNALAAAAAVAGPLILIQPAGPIQTPIGAALAFGAAGGALVFAFATMARTALRARRVQRSGWPLIAGAAACAGLAATTLTAAAWDGFMLAAVALVWTHAARTWRATPFALAAGATGAAAATVAAFAAATYLSPAAFAAAGACAALLALASVMARRAPPSAHVWAPALGWSLEAAALAAVLPAALLGAVAALPTSDGVTQLGVVSALSLAGAYALRAAARSAHPRLRGAAAWALIAGGVVAAGAVWVGPLNPWWGAFAAPVQGGAVLNTLLIGLAAPAALLGAHARLGAPSLPRQIAWTLGGLAAVGAALWAALVARWAVHGPDLTGAAIAPAELAVWSVTVALIGAACLFDGVRRGAAGARRIGAALLAAAAVKFLVVDLSALGWAPGYAAALIGLAGLGAAIAARGRLTALVR